METTVELTPDSSARAEFYGWAHDGRSFFYGYNKRDPNYMDIMEMDLANFESTMIYENVDGYTFNGISPNKKYLAFVQPLNTNDTELFLYNRESKEMNKISTGLAAHYVADFSVDR